MHPFEEVFDPPIGGESSRRLRIVPGRRIARVGQDARRRAAQAFAAWLGRAVGNAGNIQPTAIRP
jgi:hypothetical protein